MLRKYDHLSIVALILQKSTPLYDHDEHHLNTIAITKTSLMLNEERQMKKKARSRMHTYVKHLHIIQYFKDA